MAHPLSILVVEDHPDSAELLRIVLERGCHFVTVASGYGAALRSARALRFDLLIADLTLPDGDGCELLAEIRSLYPIKAVALTGQARQASILRCERAGFDHHLTKPYDFADLDRVLEDVSLLMIPTDNADFTGESIQNLTLPPPHP